MRNDDLQLLREFRAEIPAPDEQIRSRIYAHATSQPRPGGRRWRLPSVALAAGVAAAVVAVLLVSPWSGSDGGLVQRALAAVGTGPVMHIVVEVPPSTVYVNLKTGHQTAETVRQETWFDRQNDRYRGTVHVGDRLVSDYVGTSHYRAGSEAAAMNNFYLALVTGYRKALANGTAKLVARGTFDGHQIDWLSEGLGEQVGLDAHTYKPILLRFRSGKRYEYTRILLARAIAYAPVDFKRRGPKQQAPGPTNLTPGYAFGSANPSSAASTVVHSPWLTAGATAGGLELRAVTPFTIRKSKHRFSYGAPRPKAIRGLALVYGSGSHGLAPTVPTPVNIYGRPRDPLSATRFTTIYELPGGNTAPWAIVPAGSIEIQRGYTTVGNRVAPTPWIGYLRKHGLYITISTPEGRHTALQIARSLHLGR
jgi:hypothetical protein